MSHTSIIKDHENPDNPDTVFNYNSDWSGDIQIISASPPLHESVVIPFEHLLRFMAERIREQRISELEDKSWREILGLEEPS